MSYNQRKNWEPKPQLKLSGAFLIQSSYASATRCKKRKKRRCCAIVRGLWKNRIEEDPSLVLDGIQSVSLLQVSQMLSYWNGAILPEQLVMVVERMEPTSSTSNGDGVCHARFDERAHGWRRLVPQCLEVTDAYSHWLALWLIIGHFPPLIRSLVGRQDSRCWWRNLQKHPKNQRNLQAP